MFKFLQSIPYFIVNWKSIDLHYFLDDFATDGTDDHSILVVQKNAGLAKSVTAVN